MKEQKQLIAELVNKKHSLITLKGYWESLEADEKAFLIEEKFVQLTTEAAEKDSIEQLQWLWDQIPHKQRRFAELSNFTTLKTALDNHNTSSILWVWENMIKGKCDYTALQKLNQQQLNHITDVLPAPCNCRALWTCIGNYGVDIDHPSVHKSIAIIISERTKNFLTPQSILGIFNAIGIGNGNKKGTFDELSKLRLRPKFLSSKKQYRETNDSYQIAIMGVARAKKLLEDNEFKVKSFEQDKAYEAIFSKVIHRNGRTSGLLSWYKNNRHLDYNNENLLQIL